MHKAGDQYLQLAMIDIDARCGRWNIQNARGPDHDHPEDLRQFTYQNTFRSTLEVERESRLRM